MKYAEKNLKIAVHDLKNIQTLENLGATVKY